MQSSTAVMSNILECVEVLKRRLLALREEDQFQELFNETTTIGNKLLLIPLQIPRLRVPPSRYCGPSSAHQPDSPLQYYRIIYYKLIDMALNQLVNRFSRTSGLGTYLRLEQLLLSGEIDDELLAMYKDIDSTRLKTQMQMLRNECGVPTSINDVKECLLKMSPDARRLFTQVELILRLLLVCPVSTCHAERSFSALRRLKTWLRNRIGQV
jgi:hypothetical protein